MMTRRQQATYCVGTLSYGLCVIARVCLALTSLCFVYIYNALQHFNIFYRTKGIRRVTRMRQSMRFSHAHQKYSSFIEGTSSSVFFQMICFVMAPFLGL